MDVESSLEFATLQDLDSTFAQSASSASSSESTAAGYGDSLLDSCHELILQVGAGAMGEVYLAQDRHLLRKVAYKRLHSQVNVNSEVLGRFVREVQITAQLEHPHIVPVYKLEKLNDSWAYSMKLVFGKTLKELIQDARQHHDQILAIPSELSRQRFLEHFIKVCQAMDYAHQHGVIHRDLKPANIMVGRFGEVYVMDWGIARLIGSQNGQEQVAPELNIPLENDQAAFEQTRAGQIMGTPRYLSPEQAAGRNDQLDGRSDLLTLGLILFELLSLKPAYAANNLTDLLKKVLKTEKSSLVPYHRDRPIPRELAAIIHKATARKAADRYQSVAEMIADLKRYQAGQAVLAQPDTPLQALARWFSHHQLLSAALISSIVFILLSLSVLSLWQQFQHRQQQHLQEQKLSYFQTSSAGQAQVINHQLGLISSYLQNLNAAATMALQQVVPLEPFYTQQDMNRTQHAPADFRLSIHYSKKISLDYPLVQPAQTKPPRLLTVRQSLISIFRRLLPNGAELDILRKQALPVSWAMIALESGEWLAYPGQAGYPTGFDPRTQDWYQQGLKSNEPIWGRPHADTQGQGLMLPVFQRIQDAQGRVLGVSCLEMSFEYLVEHLMGLNIAGVIEIYLINPQGQIMVKGSEKERMQGMPFGGNYQAQSIETPLFDQHSVVRAIRAHQAGILQYYRQGRPVILSFYPLKALGWYYAVEIDQTELLKSETKPASSGN